MVQGVLHLQLHCHILGIVFYLQKLGMSIINLICGIYMVEGLQVLSHLKTLVLVEIFGIQISLAIELSMKSLKEGSNLGFDPFQRFFFIESSLAHHVLEPLLKVGSKFWDLLFAPLKLVREFKDLRCGMLMELAILNHRLAYVRVAWSTHSSRTSQKVSF